MARGGVEERSDKGASLHNRTLSSIDYSNKAIMKANKLKSSQS